LHYFVEPWLRARLRSAAVTGKYEKVEKQTRRWRNAERVEPRAADYSNSRDIGLATRPRIFIDNKNTDDENYDNNGNFIPE